MTDLKFHCFHEGQPGLRWGRHFRQQWPRYRDWYLARYRSFTPDRAACEAALHGAMPELVPVYHQLGHASAADDVTARFLSQYCPPPYLTGCSQAAWSRGHTALIRNYDYSPGLFEGTLAYTHWRRPVIAMLDCLWGVLDGINDAGLAVSLAFGGSQAFGKGFGITLILRYLLETCATTGEAVSVLSRLTSHMTYNVTMLDRSGTAATVYLDPHRPARTAATATAANHQGRVEWEAYANMTGSVQRKLYLDKRLEDPAETLTSMVRHFLEPPLYQTRYDSGYGTLYTAVYDTGGGEARFLWPGKVLRQTFVNFTEGRFTVRL